MKYRIGKRVLIVSVFMLTAWISTGAETGLCSSIASNDDAEHPCFSQSWSDGQWFPADTANADSMFRGTTVDGQVLYVSSCPWCRSVRLVNRSLDSQKIISPLVGKGDKCEHRWIPAVSKVAFEPVYPGEILIITYEDVMYAMRIIDIEKEKQRDCVSYQLARLDAAGAVPHLINLDNLPWESVTKTQDMGTDASDMHELVAGLRSIIAYPTTGEALDGMYNGPCLAIEYDGYCGGITGPLPLRYPTLTRVAIIHKADYVSSEVIDLFRFRFKSWEDGLGNRCDSMGERKGVSLRTLSSSPIHFGAVQALVVTPDTECIATGGEDGRVVIQHLDRGTATVIGPFSSEQIFALAVSRNGHSLLAAGNYDLFQSVLKLEPSTGLYSDIPVKASGTITFLGFCSVQDRIVFVTPTEMCWFDTAANKQIRCFSIGGDSRGTIANAAGSPDGRFFALVYVTDDKHFYEVRVFDQGGIEVMSHRYEVTKRRGSPRAAFPTSGSLAVFLPTGKACRWTYTETTKDWHREPDLLVIDGPCSVVCCTKDGSVAWIGKGSDLLAIDMKTGQTIHKHHMGGITSASDAPNCVITAIALIRGTTNLAVGMSDGRVIVLDAASIGNFETTGSASH